MPGETYQERNFLWKKILIHFWIPGWSFPNLLRKFFDMIFKSELQVPKRNFFDKHPLGKNSNICILGQKVKNFSEFWQKYLACLSKLHSTCPKDHFHEKNCFRKKIWFFLQTFVEYFRSFRKTFIAVLSKHALNVSTWTSWKNFSHHVRTLSHIFLALVTFCGKNNGNLQFHFRSMSLCFLENFGAKAPAGLEKLQYTCPHDWFHRNYLLWKKKHF